MIDLAYRPTPCMHCASPACVHVVPGAVVKRADGIVLIDAEKAKGHKELVDACPYGAIQWNEELGVAQKCTLCAHLLDGGWSKTRCVQSCPTGALRMVKVDEPEAAALVAAEKLETLHPEYNTKPSVLYANMYRYATCFVAGSVSKRSDGLEDCLKGATVELCRDGVEIAKTTTDAFGDFWFDRLEQGKAGLSLKVKAAGFQNRLLPLKELSTSINVGTVVLERSAS